MFVFEVGVVGSGEPVDTIAAEIAAAGLSLVRCDVDELAGLGGAEFVITTSADPDHFAALDAATAGHAVLATAAPDAPVTELAAATSRPGLVVGFWTAVDGLAEIVETDDTSPDASAASIRFARKLRRTPIRTVDAPGSVLAPLLEGAKALPEGELEVLDLACRAVDAGLAEAAAIDLAFAVADPSAPAPFASADAAGLDLVLHRLDDGAPLILRRLVAQGRTGIAAGQGFHPYPRPDRVTDGPVLLETQGDVAIAWLDNPPANVLTTTVVAALERVWETVDEAGDLAALIFASAHPATFSAGGDLRAFATMDRAGCEALVDRLTTLFDAWEASSISTVAAVGGPAFGGGCELALACDIRLAGASALFGQPEVGLGLIPAFGATQRLPRLVGRGKATEMLLTGEPITAQDAWQHGLVHRVVADHELFDVARNWARKLAGQAPVATGQIKQISDRYPLAHGLVQERLATLAAFQTGDAREGLAAFTDKREPRWTGR